MNRFKKEEIRKYREAREGLSAEEIEALDGREREEQEFKDNIQLWHGRIFSEEYDFQYDSNADASERSRGINPMSEDYIERSNARRRELGFAGYMGEGSGLPSGTRGWIAQMLTNGRHAELEAAYKRVQAEEKAAQQSTMANTLEGKLKQLEEYLDRTDWHPVLWGRTDAEILASRIYGFLFSCNADDVHQDANELLRLRMPDLDTQEIEKALGRAWEHWLEVYE